MLICPKRQVIMFMYLIYSASFKLYLQVAHITDQHLYVISTGDCRAVLGSYIHRFSSKFIFQLSNSSFFMIF